jgi:hypothetical protein
MHKETLESYKLLTFCIGFGPDIDVNTLREICKSGNGGTLIRRIPSGESLSMYHQCHA